MLPSFSSLIIYALLFNPSCARVCAPHASPYLSCLLISAPVFLRRRLTLQSLVASRAEAEAEAEADTQERPQGKQPRLSPLSTGGEICSTTYSYKESEEEGAEGNSIPLKHAFFIKLKKILCFPPPFLSCYRRFFNLFCDTFLL